MKLEKMVCLILVLGMACLCNATLVSRYQFNDDSDDQSANPLTTNGWTMGAGVANTTPGHSILDFGGNGKGVSNVGYLTDGSLFHSNAAHPSANFSFAAWVKADSTPAPFGIYDNDIGAQAISLQVVNAQVAGGHTYENGDVGGFTWDGTGRWTESDGVDALDQQWHHVVQTVSSTEIKLYVDGTLRDTLPFNGAQGPGFRLRIGSAAAYAGVTAGGAFYDDVQVYDEVIDLAGVGTILAGGVVPEPASMLLLSLGGLSLIRRKRLS